MTEPKTSILATTTVTSSDGLRDYAMYKTPSGWQHADEGCEWWQRRHGSEQEHDCKHVAEAAKKEKAALSNESISEIGGTTTALAIHEGIVIDGEVMPPGQLYRLIDEFDADLVVQGVESEVVESWGYTFGTGKNRVTGISIRGVEAAVREMVKHGEIIRCEDPRVIAEDDAEIRLVCTAIRYLVNPNTGEQIETDRATRALRQSKFQKVNDYEGEYPNRVKVGEHWEDDDKWFEKAYSKAARNAMLPLLRQDVKSQILEGFKATPKYEATLSQYERRELGQGQQGQRQPQQQLPPERAPAQPRQRAQSARNAPATQNAPAETPQTPPAPPAAPTQASGDPRKLVPQILSEIMQTSGREQYVIVGKDLLATFPDVKHPDKPALRDLTEVDDATVAKVVARLRVWQSGVDPNVSRPQESDNSDAGESENPNENETSVECVNCHVMQVVYLDTLTNETPCAACGEPIGIKAAGEEPFQ